MSVHDVLMDLSPFFLAVRTVVNREDPVGLLDAGAPQDEHDPEVGNLIKLHEAVAAEQVSAVFLRWSGARVRCHPRWRRGSRMASAKPVPSMWRSRPRASEEPDPNSRTAANEDVPFRSRGIMSSGRSRCGIVLPP